MTGGAIVAIVLLNLVQLHRPYKAEPLPPPKLEIKHPSRAPYYCDSIPRWLQEQGRPIQCVERGKS